MQQITLSILRLCCLLLCCLQQSAIANEPPAEWPTDAKQDALWLTAGVDQFAALLKHSEQPRVKGTAILVPEAGKEAISPDHMTFLRHSLAQYGWNTLLITPPAWPEQPQTKEGWKLYELAIQNRVKAALEHAKELSGNKLIISEGSSAASLLHLYSQGTLKQPDAMVAISPFLPDAALNYDVPHWYGISDYPLLDVYSTFDNRWAKATIKARATAARKKARFDFRQISMIIPPPNTGSQQWLTLQIHGWIDHLGW